MFKVPDKSISKRLAEWRKLRQNLENSSAPFDDVATFFNALPKTKIHTDPYDQSTWPTAWQLIEENQFCPFNIVLGICYTLQLSERFSNTTPKIAISKDKITNSMYYLLIIDEIVYGYEGTAWTAKNSLPKSLKNIKIYLMPSQN